MRQGNGSILSSQQEAWIKRYYEIHFDYSTEFRNTAVRTKRSLSITTNWRSKISQASIQRKRESVELLNNNRKFSHEEKDSSMSKLLKEKMSIAASMRSINEVLRYLWLSPPLTYLFRSHSDFSVQPSFWNEGFPPEPEKFYIKCKWWIGKYHQ
jgi:hypothetical protein